MADFKSAPKSLIRRLNKSISANDRAEAIKLAKHFPIIKIDGDRLILNRANYYQARPTLPKKRKLPIV